MEWLKTHTGRYKQSTLPQVMFKDPDWFYCLHEDDAFNYRPDLGAQAENIYKKSRNIRIPRSGDESYVVEYFEHPSYNKFSHFRIVPENQPHHVGSSPTDRKKVIDMYYPRFCHKYDKGGYKRFIACLKEEYFGSKNYKMTKKRCEEFFDDPSNFDI